MNHNDRVKSLIRKLLAFIKQGYPSFFYHPILTAIKSSNTVTIRHGIMRLALMLQMLSVDHVLPKQLMIASLNQANCLVCGIVVYVCVTVLGSACFSA